MFKNPPRVQKFERARSSKVPTADGERRTGGSRAGTRPPTRALARVPFPPSPSTGITGRTSITFGSASRRSARRELMVYPLGPTSFKEGECAHAPGTPNQPGTFDVARPCHCWWTLDDFDGPLLNGSFQSSPAKKTIKSTV